MSGDQADFLFTKKKKKRQADGEGGEVQPRVNSLRSRFPMTTADTTLARTNSGR